MNQKIFSICFPVAARNEMKSTRQRNSFNVYLISFCIGDLNFKIWISPATMKWRAPFIRRLWKDEKATAIKSKRKHQHFHFNCVVRINHANNWARHQSKNGNWNSRQVQYPSINSEGSIWRNTVNLLKDTRILLKDTVHTGRLESETASVQEVRSKWVKKGQFSAKWSSTTSVILVMLRLIFRSTSFRLWNSPFSIPLHHQWFKNS